MDYHFVKFANSITLLVMTADYVKNATNVRRSYELRTTIR
jgi:hypothetical protein